MCYEGFSPSFFWQIFIFIYLAVLQIIGILLAFQTRKVKLHGLRDSKFIASIIYASSIVLVVLALVTFSLMTYINIGTGISAVGILALTTIFLSLVFVPKVTLKSILRTIYSAALIYPDPFGQLPKSQGSNKQRVCIIWSLTFWWFSVYLLLTEQHAYIFDILEHKHQLWQPLLANRTCTCVHSVHAQLHLIFRSCSLTLHFLWP